MPDTCPMCGEYVNAGDVDCPYCGEPLGSGGRGNGLWREGRTLVMEKSAELPDRCVKTNEPAQHRLKRSLTWNHPALFLLLFVGLLPYFLVAGFMRKTARVHIGLTDEWMAKRRRAIVIGWAAVLLAVGIWVGGAAFAGMGRNNEATGLILTLVAIPLGLGGMIYGMFASRMIAPKRITDTHVWLKGVCPEFLNQFPRWDNRV